MTLMNGEVGGSTRRRLFALMQERAASGTHRGWVRATPRQLARLLNLEEHDVVHALHDLRKQGVVAFNLKRQTGGPNQRGSTPITGIPTRIRVARSAYLTPPAEIEQWDPTDEEPAAGVTIEQVPASLLDEGRSTVQAFANGYTDAVLHQMPAVTDQLREQSEIEPVLADFVALTKLVATRGKLLDAARLLREAGREDIADLVAEATTELTPAEVDALVLVQRLLATGAMKAVRT